VKRKRKRRKKKIKEIAIMKIIKNQEVNIIRKEKIKLYKKISDKHLKSLVIIIVFFEVYNNLYILNNIYICVSFYI